MQAGNTVIFAFLLCSSVCFAQLLMEGGCSGSPSAGDGPRAPPVKVLQWDESPQWLLVGLGLPVSVLPLSGNWGIGKFLEAAWCLSPRSVMRWVIRQSGSDFVGPLKPREGENGPAFSEVLGASHPQIIPCNSDLLRLVFFGPPSVLFINLAPLENGEQRRGALRNAACLLESSRQLQQQSEGKAGKPHAFPAPNRAFQLRVSKKTQQNTLGFANWKHKGWRCWGAQSCCARRADFRSSSRFF